MRRTPGARTQPRPGSDSRVWLSYAYVTDLGYDPNEGLFADVEYAPSGDPDTVFIGGAYTGDGFGTYFPVAVGDMVLVANSNGDPANGPLIVGRLWNAGAKPPVQLKDANNPADPTQDAWLVMRPGQRLHIQTSGSGDGVSIAVGDGDCTITANGVVKLQNASQSFVRGDDYADALGSFLDALSTLMQTLATAPPAPPNAALTVAAVLAAVAPFIPQLETFKAARSTYLSQKVKGE